MGFHWSPILHPVLRKEKNDKLIIQCKLDIIPERNVLFPSSQELLIPSNHQGL